MIPCGSSPNVGILMPSGRTVSLEISVQAPTRSLAVCATAVLGAATPRHSTVIALRARLVRRFIASSSDFQRNRLLRDSYSILVLLRPRHARVGSDRRAAMGGEIPM